MNNIIELALLKLGYNKDWINFGIINEEYLLNQFQIFEKSDDKNSEHYRSKAFLDYINKNSSLSDSELENCINLKDEGADVYDLYENRLHELIRFPSLSDQQFERIGKIAELHSNSLRKIFKRIKIIRQIEKVGIDVEIINNSLELKDPVLEKTLVEYKNIPKNCLELLETNGSSKAIRNMAKSILNSSKYKKVT